MVLNFGLQSLNIFLVAVHLHLKWNGHDLEGSQTCCVETTGAKKKDDSGLGNKFRLVAETAKRKEPISIPDLIVANQVFMDSDSALSSRSFLV